MVAHQGRCGIDGPTDTIRGSEERLRVLQLRAAMRRPLKHPGDRDDPGDRTLVVETGVNGKPIGKRTVRLAEPARPTGLAPKTFSARLRFFRLQAGLSQSALAGMAGIAPDHVSRLERGVKSFPRLDTLSRLADAMDVSLDMLRDQPDSEPVASV